MPTSLTDATGQNPTAPDQSGQCHALLRDVSGRELVQRLLIVAVVLLVAGVDAGYLGRGKSKSLR